LAMVNLKLKVNLKDEKVHIKSRKVLTKLEKSAFKCDKTSLISLICLNEWEFKAYGNNKKTLNINCLKLTWWSLAGSNR
jgi:hypothetical protein